MAKEQNLFLNPTKISGICGRLLCCLSYEQSNYEIFHKQCPKIGKKYVTREGTVKVVRANLFRNSLTVFADGGEEREYTLEEWEALEPTRPDRPQQGGQQQSGDKRQPPQNDSGRKADQETPRLDASETGPFDDDAGNHFYGKVLPDSGQGRFRWRC